MNKKHLFFTLILAFAKIQNSFAMSESSLEQIKCDKNLQQAASDGDLNEVRKFVENFAADITSKNMMGKTPITLAIENGYIGKGYEDVIKYLMDRLDIQLCIAAACGQLGKVKKLVECGANVNTMHQGMTPLHFAAANGKADICQFLLDNNANILALTDDFYEKVIQKFINSFYNIFLGSKEIDKHITFGGVDAVTLAQASPENQALGVMLFNERNKKLFELCKKLGSQTKCTICDKNFTKNDVQSVLFCGHCFHSYCLNHHKELSACPICKIKSTKSYIKIRSTDLYNACKQSNTTSLEEKPVGKKQKLSDDESDNEYFSCEDIKMTDKDEKPDVIMADKDEKPNNNKK
jgi:hypothetical protein